MNDLHHAGGCHGVTEAGKGCVDLGPNLSPQPGSSKMRVSSSSLGPLQLIGSWIALLGTCCLIGLILHLVDGSLS